MSEDYEISYSESEETIDEEIEEILEEYADGDSSTVLEIVVIEPVVYEEIVVVSSETANLIDESIVSEIEKTSSIEVVVDEDLFTGELEEESSEVMTESEEIESNVESSYSYEVSYSNVESVEIISVEEAT
jgi:hypothetical protein